MNSKAKGNSFERLVSEKLSLWLTKGGHKRACWRSDTSGGAATVWAKKGEEKDYVSLNAGDVRQVLDKGRFSDLDNFFATYTVELKHYKQIDFYPPFNKVVGSFFESCLKERFSTGKKSILIVRANNRKILYFSEVKHETLDYQLIVKYKDLTMYCYLFDEVTGDGTEVKKIEKTKSL